jgi:hypothetical protein
MTMTMYSRVKAYQQSVERECMCCNRPATTVAIRGLEGFTMQVWHCNDHAHLRKIARLRNR